MHNNQSMNLIKILFSIVTPDKKITRWKLQPLSVQICDLNYASFLSKITFSQPASLLMLLLLILKYNLMIHKLYSECLGVKFS